MAAGTPPLLPRGRESILQGIAAAFAAQAFRFL